MEVDKPVAFSSNLDGLGQLTERLTASLERQAIIMSTKSGVSLLATFAGAGSAIPIIGTIVGLLTGIVLSIFGSKKAKEHAEHEAERARRRAFIDAATASLYKMGYVWWMLGVDFTEDDLFNLQAAINNAVTTGNHSGVINWMLSFGLDPTRISPQASPISPDRASNLEKFLCVTELLKKLGYPTSMVDTIEYSYSNIGMFSDFYYALHKMKSDSETLEIVYRLSHFFEENYMDPYLILGEREKELIVQVEPPKSWWVVSDGKEELTSIMEEEVSPLMAEIPVWGWVLLAGGALTMLSKKKMRRIVGV